MLDEDLAKTIYENDGAALFGMALRETGGDREWAKDVVQETVVRAWRNAHKLDPSRALQPWLFTVARRIIIDGRRNRSARPREVEATVLEHLPVSDDTENSLSVMMMREALNTLTPAHREVIFEVYFRGHTVREAAKVLGVPAGTVRSRIYYAMRALRNALEERGLTSSI